MPASSGPHHQTKLVEAQKVDHGTRGHDQHYFFSGFRYNIYMKLSYLLNSKSKLPPGLSVIRRPSGRD